MTKDTTAKTLHGQAAAGKKPNLQEAVAAAKEAVAAAKEAVKWPQEKK